jgi:hypothetical protein
LINELECITFAQKQKLAAILMKHQGNFTKKPGKCKGFEYTFQVQGQLPKSTYSRPLPFALRPAVGEEIRQLIKDDILEESHSSYLNPLTVVQREGKSPRICVDARKLNQAMLPDRAKVAPMQEILQRFHGTRYITTLDLSSAFLQVPLDKASRKYTAFEFQLKRCMHEISKFCKIYCSQNHRKWAELLPKIEEWLNTTVADSTGFTPVELLLEAKKSDLFEKILTKSMENLPELETVGNKVMKAYARMRKKARDRRERRKTGNKTWEPKVNEKVLVKAHPTSDAAVGVTAKFIHPYEGPYIITRVIPPSTYELSTTNERLEENLIKGL